MVTLGGINKVRKGEDLDQNWLQSHSELVLLEISPHEKQPSLKATKKRKERYLQSTRRRKASAEERSADRARKRTAAHRVQLGHKTCLGDVCYPILLIRA